MRFARLVCCGAVAVWLLGPARQLPLHGQDPQGGSQPTFHATTALVEVDVIALDASGQFVPGLMADDLKLYEDGKPQKIQQFYMVSHDIAAAPSLTAPTSGPQAEERAHRVFVIMFDEGHLAIDSLMRVKKGAEMFIRDQMGPGDIGGVFANGTMYRGRLTTDKNELIAAVRSSRPAAETRQSLLAPFREWPRIPGETDATRIEGGDRQLVDFLGQQACTDDPRACIEEGGLQQVENLLQKKALLYVRQARVMTARTMLNLQYITGNLSRIPGRKTVVFLSEGFYVEESRADLRMVAAQAARGGTTIYSIDGRGLTGGSSPTPDVIMPSMARSTAFDTGEDGPTILTGETGGLVVRNVDDISRAFGVIARDTSTYYVLGYEPDNGTMDGKFRKIEVKPTVKGVRIRARKGYLAAPLPPLQSIRSGG